MDSVRITECGLVVKLDDYSITNFVDCSAAVDEKIPVCQRLCQEGKLTEALDILMSLEKLTSRRADTHSTGRVLVAIVRLCFETKNYKALNENIVLLTKRCSEMKQAIIKMIQECCNYVDQMPDKTTMLEYLVTLQSATSMKIYVEEEHIRVTKKLAKIREDEGKMEEAETIIQELQSRLLLQYCIERNFYSG